MAVKIFFCYAHEDEPLLNKLKTHLRPLQRQGLIDIWHDRDISAGAEREREISQHLNTAQIILLLVSPDFMNSDYCYGIEMRRAIDRHERGEACVIPIILRPVDWQIEPLSKLQALPRDAEPVTMWQNYDAAFLDVAKGIRKVVKKLAPKSSVNSSVTPMKTIEELTTQFSLTLPIIPVQAPQPEPVKLVSASKPEDFTLIRTLTGHSDFVSSVAFSSDGQTLASSGGFADQKIMLWNLHTADLLHILAGHSSTVFSIVISPNGQILASGSHDKTIKLWNLSTTEEIHTIKGHPRNSVDTVAFSLDGQVLASGGGSGRSDNPIKLWNPHTGELLRTLSGHFRDVFSVAFSPDGQMLASGSMDKTIKLWDIHRGKVLRTLIEHSDWINSVAFSPDGQMLASGSSDKTIKLWNPPLPSPWLFIHDDSILSAIHQQHHLYPGTISTAASPYFPSTGRFRYATLLIRRDILEGISYGEVGSR